MSINYSANQYQQAFNSRRLQNWELPAPHKKYPPFPQGTTEIIGTDRGHIKPGRPRSSENPWGNFVGTWDMPVQIPGHKVRVSTARAPPAADKLVRNAEQSERVITGTAKNEDRQNNKEGPAAL